MSLYAAPPPPSEDAELQPWTEGGWYECAVGWAHGDGARQWGNHVPAGREWRRHVKTVTSRHYAPDGSIEHERTSHLIEMEFEPIGTVDLPMTAVREFGWLAAVVRVALWLAGVVVPVLPTMLGCWLGGWVLGWVLEAGFERDAPVLARQLRDLCGWTFLLPLTQAGWRFRARHTELRGRQALHAD